LACFEGVEAETLAPMMTMPADFAIRLAGGLAAMLLITSWRQVPPAFFRTMNLVILGMLVAACLTAMGVVPKTVLGPMIVASVLAYLASAFWGLGVPRIAIPLTISIVALSLGLLVWTSWSGATRGSSGLMVLNTLSRISSAALLGSTLAAMLLGHHYLTAPAMSIDPLKRYVAAMAWTLPPRVVLASIAFVLTIKAGMAHEAVSPLFLAMRWGMGVLGPAVATYLSWQTVRIRSTQAATGILYIGMTLLLFGELAGLILGRESGVEL
jgi:hypothetical protein